MSRHGELLVAILNNIADFGILRTQHWYRIPVDSVKKWLKGAWPPQWVAFYMTKIFDHDAFGVKYYAEVYDVHQVSRYELFPDEHRSEKSNKRYYKIILGPLQQLPKPILSLRRRRIIFIPTTWKKFTEAKEINDLHNGSYLEDHLWVELKRLRIDAERQEFVQIQGVNYALDFAVYCQLGKLDIETDGDTWHANPERSREDNIRNNILQIAGWYQLRFNTNQVCEQMAEYCVPKIVKSVNRLGRVADGELMWRKINLKSPQMYQLGLADTRAFDDSKDL